MDPLWDCCDDCSFTYKRFPHDPSDSDDPDIVYRPGVGSDTLHVSDQGWVLVGTRVYAPDATDADDVHCLAPALPDPNAKWLWISDNYELPSHPSDKIFLYALRSWFEQVFPKDMSEDPYVTTHLNVWKWDQLTDTTTLIIEHEYLVTNGAGPSYYDTSAYGNSLRQRIYFRQIADPGAFESPFSYKLGDVRLGRIVIAGLATWYMEGGNAFYEYNSEIGCWDRDGVKQWTTNLGDFYDADTIQVFDTFDTFEPINPPPNYAPLPLLSQNHFSGYPKPLRVRIGADQGVYVLTTHSRVPTEWGFEWDGGHDFHGKYEDGASSQPCFWKVCDDLLTATGTLPAGNFRVFGRPNGDVFDEQFFREMTAIGVPIGSEGLVPGDVDRLVLNSYWDLVNDIYYPATGFLIYWDDATGGDPPYTYDVERSINGATYETIAIGVTSPYRDPPNDIDFDPLDLESTVIAYRIKVTDSRSPTPRTATSHTVEYRWLVYNAKLTSARDFDVSVEGYAAITLRTASGHGLVALEPDDFANESDDSDTDENGSRLRGFKLTANPEYLYAELSPEYAGPVFADSGRVWVLRSGANGTYLAMVDFVDGPGAPYEVNRIWSCSYWPYLNLERSKRFDGPPSGSQIHTSVASGNRVVESDTPCPPCDDPVDDPCGGCPDKTRKVAWELIDSPFADNDAATAHLATAFMQCQDSTQPLFECTTITDKQNPYYNVPWTFRPNALSEEQLDCAWQLCGPYIVTCSRREDWEEFPPPAPQSVCLPTNVPFATMGKYDESGTLKFLLIFWRVYADYETGTIIGPERLATYEAPLEEICGPEATFEKIEDNSAGEVSTLPYFEEPYFRQTIRARRAVMETLCDIPQPPEPEPWCPGDETEPPAKLCFGVEMLNQPSAADIIITYPGEPDPPDLDYDDLNSWVNGSFHTSSDCLAGSFLDTNSYSIALVHDDITDPMGGWELHVQRTDRFSNVTNFILTPTSASCPPLGLTFEATAYTCDHTTDMGTPKLIISVYPCPEPEMMMMASSEGSTLSVSSKSKTLADLPCVHRGEALRADECPTCSGSVKLKVFDCAVHGECTIIKRLGDVKTCNGCKQREAPSVE